MPTSAALRSRLRANWQPSSAGEPQRSEDACCGWWRAGARAGGLRGARHLRQHWELRALRREEQRERDVDRTHAAIDWDSRIVHCRLQRAPRYRAATVSIEGGDHRLSFSNRTLRSCVLQHRSRLVHVDEAVAVLVVRVEDLPQLVLLEVLEAEWCKRCWHGGGQHGLRHPNGACAPAGARCVPHPSVGR